MSQFLNIAIVSTNRYKYSETFIHNHVRLLPGNVHFLYGGYLPTGYSTDRGLTGKPLSSVRRASWLSFAKTPAGGDLPDEARAVERYLEKERINVVLCEYGPSGVAMLPVTKRLNTPMVVHFHGYDAYREDILATYGKHYGQLFEQSAAVIAVSHHMRSQLERLGCDKSKLHTLVYGVDTSLFTALPRVPKEFTFVSCGRFVGKKGPQLTIRAFAKVLEVMPGATLAMIGDGELLMECKELAAHLGLGESVKFTGVIRQDQVAEVFRKSSVFVQHSLTTSENDSEGTPLAVMESGACALPVVATLHGGIPQVVVEGETGFLVKEGDVEAMAEKMLWLAMNKEQSVRMGGKASQRIRDSYTLEDYTRKLTSLLTSVAK